MTTIMPEGEEIRNAIKWISEKRALECDRINELIEQAAVSFDLSPLETDFLYRFFAEKPCPKSD